MRFLFPLIILGLSGLYPLQEPHATIRFPATDELEVTADVYRDSLDSPYIILLHGEQSSRGEYREIAPRLMKFHYHCLAVDLRTGKRHGYIRNETAEAARNQPGLIHPVDAEKDLRGALDYAWDQSGKPVILMGNASSASLALLVACDDPRVRAVIALSPGEYFKPFIQVRDSIQDLRKPVFAAGSSREKAYLDELFEKMDPATLTLFEPDEKSSYRGTDLLTEAHPGQDEYWLSLIFFFNSLRKSRTGQP